MYIRYLATSCEDRAVRIFGLAANVRQDNAGLGATKAADAKTVPENELEMLMTLEGHWDCVRAVAFSPNNSSLVLSASNDNLIILWHWQL